MHIVQKNNSIIENTKFKSIGNFNSICILSIEDMINPNLACKLKGCRFDLILIPKIFQDNKEYQKLKFWVFFLPSLLHKNEKKYNIAYY